MATKIDIHAVLKQAIKDLPADANPADVAAYIDAECAKQAAIEGAAAAEEKKIEKEVEAAAAPLADLPKEEPPAKEDKPEDKIDEPPPALSQVAPAAVPAHASGSEGANGPGADLAETPGAADAGATQIGAILAQRGSDVAALIAAITADPAAFDAFLAGAAGAGADAGGATVSEGQAEGLQPLSALKTEVARLTTECAAKDATIAALSARASSAEAVKVQTEAEKAADAKAAAEKATADRRAALSTEMGEHIRCARLIPAQGRSTDQTIETWTELGMSMPDAKFRTYLSTALGPGVPTQALTAQAQGADSPGKDVAASRDADEETPEWRGAFLSYRHQFGDEQAKRMAHESVKRARNGGTSPTSKITGTA